MNKKNLQRQSFTVAALPENIGILQEFVCAQAKKARMPDATTMRLELLVEELALNIMNYGYESLPGKITLSCEVESSDPQQKKFLMEIRDKGVPFNPLIKPDADTGLDVESREPGGLGIFLTKQIADELRYHHDGTSNILVVSIHFTTDSQARQK